MIHESTLPYQGGQGGSNLKSIFNLIITSYLVEIPHSPTSHVPLSTQFQWVLAYYQFWPRVSFLKDFLNKSINQP
ncbi:MAG: hypothetical protein EWV63_01525 [Microcystis aeruginosa Ma_OC_H_19870700_S124]|uniref:Uncharacterized protein n=1 Tax=Microcystis aeruginosa Ma_OC_H_19870700_S124 TaxID=2486262 RepID=A0A552AXX1_MICAE|nr:MAG: hypothetical protein EWV63_01525 [Microcystis aeruginosa Ma_OC_H_19870700_S124]